MKGRVRGQSRGRVTHVTTVHTAFDTRIFWKECISLTAAGFDVTLVVPFAKDAELHGVRVRAIPTARRRWGRIVLTLPSAFVKAWSRRADVYHLHDPELLVLAPLLAVRGTAVVFDCHEDLPSQIQYKDWIPSRLRRPVAALAMALEMFGTRFCTKVVAEASYRDRKTYASAVLVRNYPRLEEFSGVLGDCRANATERGRKVVYVGGVTTARGAIQMAMAVGEVDDIEFDVLGSVESRGLADEIVRLSRGRANLLGPQDRTGVVRALGRAAVGLAVLHPYANYTKSEPTKLFEYMAAGVPVVVSDFPLWRKVVMDAECGLLVDPLDPSAIADAIRWILEHPEDADAMGRNGQAAVVEQYNWEQESVRLTDLYKQLVDN